MRFSNCCERVESGSLRFPPLSTRLKTYVKGLEKRIAYFESHLWESP